MTLDYNVIAAYIAGILFLYLLGRLFLIPARIILKLFFNAIIGGAALVVINAIGGLFGFHIALNIISALIVGILGIPGILLLSILKVIFHF